VRDDDTPETLASRVQAAERRIVPEAIRLIAEGRLAVEGRRVRIKGADSDRGDRLAGRRTKDENRPPMASPSPALPVSPSPARTSSTACCATSAPSCGAADRIPAKRAPTSPPGSPRSTRCSAAGSPAASSRELYGPLSSGRTSLALALLARATESERWSRWSTRPTRSTPRRRAARACSSSGCCGRAHRRR
jgi:hypothetical protein